MSPRYGRIGLTSLVYRIRDITNRQNLPQPAAWWPELVSSRTRSALLAKMSRRECEPDNSRPEAGVLGDLGHCGLCAYGGSCAVHPPLRTEADGSWYTYWV